MILTYFKVAWRNIMKSKAYSFINIFGLAAGLTCCMLITVYLLYEFSYDSYQKEVKDMYQVEHDELFAGIRSGKFINDGESAAHSTLMALMAREAAYTGKRLTWKQLMASNQNLAPKEYTWGPIETPAVPTPGIYKFA